MLRSRSSLEVGDGAGYFEGAGYFKDWLLGAGAEARLPHRPFEQAFGVSARFAAVRI